MIPPVIPAYIEIETSSYCNWRCVCCPLTYTPKPQKIMSLELFQYILNKCKGLTTTISINSYNEPTINPNFTKYVDSIAFRGFHLLLHTNASALTLDKLKHISKTSRIVFNLPSLDPLRFIAKTGGANLLNILVNIDRAIAHGYCCEIVVNGTNAEVAQELPAIAARYPKQLNPLYAKGENFTNDRCGVLTADQSAIHQAVNITEPRLTGCSVPLNTLFINVDGDMFLCCMDFNQTTKFANVQDYPTIQEALQKATPLYEQVFGVRDADANLICRKCCNMLIQRGRFKC